MGLRAAIHSRTPMRPWPCRLASSSTSGRTRRSSAARQHGRRFSSGWRRP